MAVELDEELMICPGCGESVCNSDAVYRVQTGLTKRHTKGNHVIFDNQMGDNFLCASCGDLTIRHLALRFQKQPDKCSMCKELIDDDGEIIFRMTRGVLYMDYKLRSAEFEEDTEKPSMIPDYYFCGGCGLSEFNQDVYDDYMCLEQMIGYGRR